MWTHVWVLIFFIIIFLLPPVLFSYYKSKNIQVLTYVQGRRPKATDCLWKWKIGVREKRTRFHVFLLKKNCSISSKLCTYSYIDKDQLHTSTLGEILIWAMLKIIIIKTSTETCQINTVVWFSLIFYSLQNFANCPYLSLDQKLWLFEVY